MLCINIPFNGEFRIFFMGVAKEQQPICAQEHN